MTRPQFIYIHESHLDLFWIGDFRYCLERGRHVIKQYLDRCLEYPDESFLLETAVFLEHFLGKHPDYEETVRKLWQEGRLDIGAAYVDIMEHLVLGESQIRNIARGRRVCRDGFGIDTRLAAHADLPALCPQVPQMYRQAGIDCYATSRKIFPNGQVWVYAAPDGTTLRVFSHPNHYDFHKLRRNAAELNEGRGWMGSVDPDEALKGFPLGKVVLSAGAGDQADMECFVKRFGRPAREFIEEYRRTFPEIEFRFGTVSEIAAEYEGHEDLLPRLSGEIPSVWGMTSVPSSFWQRARRLEGRLLTAELLASLQRWYGLETIDASRGEWFGTLFERLYYLGNDPIPRGDELDELWKMHIFICDHNFSGNFAAQTLFDKRTIQERALSYADEMVAHGMAVLAGPDANESTVLFLNPLNWARTEPVEIALPGDWTDGGLELVDERGSAIPVQALGTSNAEDGATEVMALPAVPPVAWAAATIRPVRRAATQVGPRVRVDEGSIALLAAGAAVAVDRRTGALTTLRDVRTGADWGSDRVGRLYAVYEEAFDVPLRVDESRVLAQQEVRSVEVSAAGPLFASARVVKSILHAHVVQEVTVWQSPVDAVDLKTTILWHGRHRVQMRQCMPTAATRDDVFYGTPFYGNNWPNVVPGSGPRNPDEMGSPEQWDDYRELQLWIHQRRVDSALAMASLHATYHWGAGGLEAVLMRTTPSGADPRFFWEHTGRLEFAFRFRFTAPDESLAFPTRMGQELVCPVVAASPGGPGLPQLPAGVPFVDIDGDGVVLSAVHPDADTGGIIVRFFEACGSAQTVTVRVRDAGALERVDLLGAPIGEAAVQSGEVTIQVRPHEIVTLRAMPQAE